MKIVLKYLLVFALVSSGSYHLTIHFIPNFIYHKFYSKVFVDADSKLNEFTIIMAPDENSRLVVKPNPDFAYASAFFDISDGPIRILGTMPDSTYWSIAAYQPNTVNFFVKNDLQFDSNTIDVSLANSKSDHKPDILSPVNTGFILARLLIDNRDKKYEQELLSYLESLQIEKI